MRLPLVRLVGAGVLTLVVAGVGVEALMERHATAARFVVPFDRGEHLGDGADAEVAKAASMLKAYPGFGARVVGYTEAGGDPSADVSLSTRRAEIVRDMLADDGVTAGRIAAFGRGAVPDAAAGTRSAHVEIVLERR